MGINRTRLHKWLAEWKYVLTFASVGFLVGAVVCIAPWYVKQRVGSANSDRSEWASSFAPAEALFGGLAFVGVIVALWMQRDELELQREELVATREVLKSQAAESAKQVAAIQKQVFEHTFFQLLRQQEEIRNAVTRNHMTGREAIRFYANMTLDEMRRVNHTDRTQAMAHYGKVLAPQLAEPLGHYFRNLYVTLRLINDNAGEDAPLYVRMLRAPLSQSELALLFYNAFGPQGVHKMLPLAIKHRLFKNLDPTALAFDNHNRWLQGA